MVFTRGVITLLLGCMLSRGILSTGPGFFRSEGISDFEAHNAIKRSLDIAHRELEHQKELNEILFNKGIDSGGQRSQGPVSWTSINQHGRIAFMSEDAFSESEHAFVCIRATQELTKYFGKSIPQLKRHSNVRAIWRKLNAPFCSVRRPRCKKGDLYRTADGSCNNMEWPTWGMSNRPQKRYLPAAYLDGITVPRTMGVTGKPLPSARLVSNMIHQPAVCDLLEPKQSAMVMQWGQHIDHDFIDTPTMKGFHGADISCCNTKPDVAHKRSACLPIPIPSGDKHFLQNCMNFVRSTPGPNDGCEFGARNQLNQATSYIDASYIYGIDDDSMRKLREGVAGRLKMNKAGLFAPTEDQDKCMREKPGDYCMQSGDDRIHVVPGLASLQILFLREHNRLAAILGKINPHWSDETIFQEARKIVSALNQHITYVEYLPLVLGPIYMAKYGLYSKPKGFNTVYNPTVDATTANVFGVAAFRFGHSTVPNHVAMIREDHKKKVLGIEETYNRPSTTLEDFGKGSDHVCRWLLYDKSAKSDRFLDTGVRDLLFLDKNGGSFDLAALNIQRGRDHGIPGYNAWRKWCGLPPAFHFGKGPGGLMDLDPDAAMLLSKVYHHPDDIDLFPAAMAEKHVPGATVGPTFACIIARQFQEWKKGDRFWYENKFAGTGFTLGQLNEIKKVRLSRVICNNIKNPHISPNAFIIPSKGNPTIPCQALPDIDLRFWRAGPRKPMPMKFLPPMAMVRSMGLW